jgi:hypothetical protein
MGMGFLREGFFDCFLRLIRGGEGGVIKDQVYRMGSFEWSGGERVWDA